MSTSDQHDVRGLLDPIGVFMERPVVDQQHTLTHRYPQALMPVRRVRVDGFTISLDLNLASNPEAERAGRWVFEQVCDAIKNCIVGLDRGHRPDGDMSHESSSPLSQGAATPRDLSVEPALTSKRSA